MKNAKSLRFLDFIPDSIVISNKSGKIVYANSQTEKLFGYTREDMIGEAIEILMPEHFHEKHQKHRSKFFTDPRIRPMGSGLDLTGRSKDGSQFPVEISLAPWKNGDELLVVCTLRDVTLQKQIREDLKKNLAQLAKKNLYERIINSVNKGIAQSIDTRDILENAVEVMSKNIEGADVVSIYFVEGNEAVLKAYRGFPPSYIKKAGRIPYGKGFMWKAVIEGKPILYCADADQDEVIGPLGRKLGTKSYASIPIMHGGKAVGVININSLKKNAFNKDELKLLETIVPQIEGIIRIAQVTEALRQSEDRYRILFDQSPVGVYIFDKELNVTQCNRRMVEILQSSYENIIGRNIRALKDKTFFLSTEKTIDGQFSYQEGIYEATTSPAKLWLSQYFSPLYDEKGNVIGGIGVAEDVTERKHAEEVLQDRTNQLQAITDAMTAFLAGGHWREAGAMLLRNAINQTSSEYGFIGVVVEGPALRILAHEGMVWDHDINGEFYDNAMRSYHEVGYLEFTNFNNLFGKVITSGNPVLSNNPNVDSRSGGLPPGHPPLHHFLGVPMLRGTEVVGIIGVANRPGGYTDKELSKIQILVQAAGVLYDGYRRQQREAELEAERRQAEETLKKLSSAVEQTADNVFITDKYGVIEYVNQSFEKVSGYKKEEVVGGTPRILKSGKHGESFYEEMWKIILSGGAFRSEFINKTKSGELYYEEKTITPLKDSLGRITHFVSTGKDITEQKKLEEQLQQSQKMEAIGRLAGGIAHDFNNLLTVIISYSDLLLLRSGINSKERGNIQQIKNAGERAAALTSQLLAFSRKQILQPKVLNLNAVIAEIGKMLKRLIGEDIEMIINLDPRLDFVKADPGQIEQVILNLSINSKDAMSKGGKLILETTNVYLDETYANRHKDTKPGKYVAITVSDTGYGMDEETMSHIFEPFFTTKEMGKGTGLGLATVYGIVKQSGGDISVYSEIDRGTTFKIYLPGVEGESEELKPGVYSTEVDPPGGTETILIAEDEVIVRSILCEELSEKGYNVLEASDCDEAILICEKHSGPIHLMLTDVVMPKMSGPELAKRLKELHPDMKLLYISGYMDNTTNLNGVLEEGVPFLQKPFTSDVLLRKVRDVLDTIEYNTR